jgi:hypothetical protein
MYVSPFTIEVNIDQLQHFPALMLSFNVESDVLIGVAANAFRRDTRSAIRRSNIGRRRNIDCERHTYFSRRNAQILLNNVSDNVRFMYCLPQRVGREIP